MTPPKKPFNTYKWRWLSLMPSEGLLKAPVFLGVLRSLKNNEGRAYSSPSFYNDLRRTKLETSTNIILARDRERNIIRNSGQYWRGTGLLTLKRGEIELTPVGRQLANGEITRDEFAALTISNTVLPNPLTYKNDELNKWRANDIRIKPFELIISVVSILGKNSNKDAYITPNELIKILIPASGAKYDLSSIAETIKSYRNGKVDLSDWPDCAPKSNDKRMAKEFLIFLNEFGICQVSVGDSSVYDAKFFIDETILENFRENKRTSFIENEGYAQEEILASRESNIPEIIERKRMSINILKRTQQGRFRRDVLEACDGKCVITNEATPDVIEAAHIIPVQHGGSDAVGNGFCMRVDIHRLFDGGKIRISPDGSVSFHEQIVDAISYRELPRKVVFPASVEVEHVQWRERYL